MPWPTPALAVVLAALVATATAALTPAVLRTLPEPADPDGKPPYASLASHTVVAGVGLACLAATLLVTLTVPPAHWPAWLALASVNVLACAVDARTTWLPLPLARAGWAVAAVGAGVVAWASGSWTPLAAAALGALALGLLFHLLWRTTGAFGYGDVRLAATIGAVTALDSVGLVVWALLLGTLAGAVWGIVHRVAGGRGTFPYGPGLLAGPFLALALRAAQGGLTWPVTG